MSTQLISKVRTNLLVAALLISAASVTAKAQTGLQLRVQVPFAFQQGSKHFAAGEYTFSVAMGNMLFISGVRDSAYSLVNRGETVWPADDGKLIFQRYGNQYFLHQVWMPGQTSHIDCLKSREEKNLQKELRLASIAKQPAGVEFALVEGVR